MDFPISGGWWVSMGGAWPACKLENAWHRVHLQKGLGTTELAYQLDTRSLSISACLH